MAAGTKADQELGKLAGKLDAQIESTEAEVRAGSESLNKLKSARKALGDDVKPIKPRVPKQRRAKN